MIRLLLRVEFRQELHGNTAVAVFEEFNANYLADVFVIAWLRRRMIRERDEESHAFLIGTARREKIKTITRDILCRADILEGFHVRICGTKSERLTDFEPAVASTIRLVSVLHIPSEHGLPEIGKTLCSMEQHS